MARGPAEVLVAVGVEFCGVRQSLSSWRMGNLGVGLSNAIAIAIALIRCNAGIASGRNFRAQGKR